MLELLSGLLLQGRFDDHIVAHFAQVFCSDDPQLVVPDGWDPATQAIFFASSMLNGFQKTHEEGRLGGLQP